MSSLLTPHLFYCMSRPCLMAIQSSTRLWFDSILLHTMPDPTVLLGAAGCCIQGNVARPCPLLGGLSRYHALAFVYSLDCATTGGKCRGEATIVLCCIVLLCVALLRIGLLCIVLCCIVLHCVALLRIDLLCIVLRSIALRCIASY